MSIASSLLLLGGAAYFVASLRAVSAVDYRELVAAQAQDADEEQQQPQQQGGDGSGGGGEEEEAGGSRPASPDRPLLSAGALRS